MRVLTSNLVDSGSPVVTASSAATGYPAGNVSQTFLDRVWRTGTSVADEWIKFDFGSSVVVSAFVAAGHDLVNGSDTTVKIQGNATDSWGSPTVNQTLTFTTGKPVFHVNTGVPWSLRWWRFIFTKPSAGTTRNIGRIYIGTHTDLAGEPGFEGVSVSEEDPSTSTRTRGGSLYVDTRTTRRVFGIDFPFLTNTEKSEVGSLWESLGIHTPFFTQIDPNGSNELSEMLYARFTGPYEREVVGIAPDGGVAWDVSLELEDSR